MYVCVCVCVCVCIYIYVPRQQQLKKEIGLSIADRSNKKMELNKISLLPANFVNSEAIKCGEKHLNSECLRTNHLKLTSQNTGSEKLKQPKTVAVIG
jgi:hypothetical protein